jgi:hypothetical protein
VKGNLAFFIEIKEASMGARRYLPIAIFGATILFFLLWQTTAAKPPEKPGNPGVPGLLAEIAELEDMLDQLQYLAPVPQTGQTICYNTLGSIIDCAGTGQDGEYQYGTPWLEPRFTDNLDGTVTDRLTGLIWLKRADCAGQKTWTDALMFANSLYDGWTGDGSGGDCGLSDGSSANDWRLPNVRELLSLIDFGRHNPALPDGHPFSGVLSEYYWSSTTNAALIRPENAWRVFMNSGFTDTDPKGTKDLYVWPVRGGYQD